MTVRRQFGCQSDSLRPTQGPMRIGRAVRCVNGLARWLRCSRVQTADHPTGGADRCCGDRERPGPELASGAHRRRARSRARVRTRASRGALGDAPSCPVGAHVGRGKGCSGDRSLRLARRAVMLSLPEWRRCTPSISHPNGSTSARIPADRSSDQVVHRRWLRASIPLDHRGQPARHALLRGHVGVERRNA